MAGNTVPEVFKGSVHGALQKFTKQFKVSSKTKKKSNSAKSKKKIQFWQF